MFLFKLLSDPNGALAVNSKTSDELLEYAISILAKGITHPAFFNDDCIVDAITRLCIEKSEAVDYIHSTCAEITVSGKTRGHTTAVSVDMPRLLLEAVCENKEILTFEELKDAFLEKIIIDLKTGLRNYQNHMLEASRNGNEPMRICCFIDNCVEKCRGLYDGGAKYVFIQPILVGFATVVDSLMAIKKLCFDEKTLMLSDFYSIVQDDFKGNEPLRQRLINGIAHYGNDNPEVDCLAKELAEKIEKYSYKQINSSTFLIPGTFTYINHASMGARLGATFDGRKANFAYSDGCCPVQGRNTNGPTATINSLTCFEQSKFLAGMVVNIKFSKSLFDERKKAVLVSLIRTFISKGGIELQVNVVDKEVLMDAMIHPEDHKDLLERIGGYSEYFVRLTHQLKQEVIERMEY